MGGLTQLCCFIIIFDISIATPLILLGANNSDVYVDKKLQAQIDIIRINTGAFTNDHLDNLKTRVSTLEGLFKKLKIRRASLPNKTEELQVPTQSSNNETGLDVSVAYPLEELQMPNDEPEELKESIPDQPISVEDSADIVKISEIVKDVYSSGATNFNVLINLSKGMSNTNHTLKVLQCLHSAMKENSDLSPTKLIILAKTFRDRILIDTNIEAELKTNITTTIEQLLDTVKAEATELLVTAMKTDDYRSNATVHSLNEELYNFGSSLYAEILQKMLDSTYSKVKTDVILENIISGNKTGPIISMIRVLLSKMKSSDDLNQNVILRIASKLKELKSKYDFFKLGKDFRKNVFDAAVSELPTCARNLYFNASSICVWNVEKQNYLLAGNAIFNYDSERRSIFVAPGANTNRGAMWSVTNEGENFYFKSIKYNDNLYAEDSNYRPNYDYNRRYVFNWIRNNNDFLGSEMAWNIELEGDNCYLRNSAYNEYLFASHEAYEDFDYNRVFTSTSNHMDQHGRLWQIQGC